MDEQSFIKRKRILEAIDVLRERKYRPDIDRIGHYLFREYNVHPNETKSDLEWCVSNKSVLEVQYKGATSYRNALKKNRRKQHSKKIDTTNYKSSIRKNFMELLTNLFAELTMEKPHYLEVGVSTTDIIQEILSKDSVLYTERKIAMLLESQVRRKYLIKLENGNFMLGQCPNNKHKKLEVPTRKRGRPFKTSGQEQAKCKPIRGRPPKTPEQEQVKLKPVRGRPRKTSGQEQAKLKPTRGRPRKTSGLEQAKFNIKGTHQKRRKNNNTENMDSDINGGIQLLGRRVKIEKKVFDPSDTHVPKTLGQPSTSLHNHKSTLKKNPSDTKILKKRGRPPKSLKKSPKTDEDWTPNSSYSTGLSRGAGGVCSVCHNASVKNGKMVSCRECSNKAHYECLNGDDMMLKMSPDNTWQCPQCKTCVVCFQTSNAGNLIVCSVCADGYHGSCHQPNITDTVKNNQKWLCENCQGKEGMKPNDIQLHIGEAINYNIINDETEEPKKGKYSSRSSSPSVSISQRKCYLKSSKNTEDTDDFSESNSPILEYPSNYDSSEQSPVPSGSGTQSKIYLVSSKNQEDVEEDSDGSSPENTVPPVSSTQEQNELKSELKSFKTDKYSSSSGIDLENLDPSIPDASHWTPDEVYEYFAKIISEDEAKIFKEESINGRSLLCLGRSEVLNNFGLKLASALKVFQHITMLQVRKDDKSLYWL